MTRMRPFRARPQTAALSTMKPIIAACLILGSTAFTAGARGISILSYEELHDRSDIVVVVKPVSTKDTHEKTIIPRIMREFPLVGLSTEFEVIANLKGDKSLKRLVVHHYRLEDPHLPIINAPNFASFNPKGAARYLLFLQRESDGRYAPLDQVDPIWTSMLAVSDEWDKMTSDSYRAWMDAKRWLRERPSLGKAISPEITREGRAEASLHEAAMNGKLEKAKALIKANPDLVFRHESDSGLTALQFAAQYGHKDVAELLLANKAEVEAKSNIGWTPLFYAVRGGHKEMVEMLLANKADVNAQAGNSGWTPLHEARLFRDDDLVDLLRRHGGHE